MGGERSGRSMEARDRWRGEQRGTREGTGRGKDGRGRKVTAGGSQRGREHGGRGGRFHRPKGDILRDLEVPLDRKLEGHKSAGRGVQHKLLPVDGSTHPPCLVRSSTLCRYLAKATGENRARRLMGKRPRSLINTSEHQEGRGG